MRFCVALFLVISLCVAPILAIEINPSVDTIPAYCRTPYTKWICEQTNKPGPQGPTGPQGEKGEQNYSLMAWNITNSTLNQNTTNAWNVSSSVINSNYTFYGGTEINESYAYLPGRDGGQTLTGGTTSGDLILNASMNNGNIVLQPYGGGVGIGRTPATSSYLLDIYSKDVGTASLRVETERIAATSKAAIYLAGNATGTTNTIAEITSQSDSSGTSLALSRIRTINDGSSNSGLLAFFTTPSGGSATERVRITSLGNLSIGTTLPSAQLHTTGSVRFATFGAGTLTTDANGNLVVTSDPKLKTAITPYTGSIAKIQAINPITYKFKPETGYDTINTYTGFDASNLKTAIPEAVYTKDDVKYVQETVKSKDGGEDEVITKEVKTGTQTMSISDRAIIAALVNAVKEQQQQITALQQENKKQEERITALELKVKT